MARRSATLALGVLLLISGLMPAAGQPARPHIRVRAQFDRPRDLDPIYHTAAPEYGEMTAQDVKFTFERFTDKALAGPYAGDWANVRTIEAVDRYTVRFTLHEPNFVSLANPFAGRSAVIVSRKAVLEKGKGFSRDPIGTGPFAFESWNSADEVTVAAHDRYFGRSDCWQKPDTTPLRVSLLFSLRSPDPLIAQRQQSRVLHWPISRAMSPL